VFDVLIKGGRIIDGTGNIGFKGDIAIEGDELKILRGDTSHVQARNSIDASHHIVVPGFIDVHTHSDLIALSEPLNEAKIMQGVCTEMLGLDGVGYAPLSKKNLEMMLLYYSGAETVGWEARQATKEEIRAMQDMDKARNGRGSCWPFYRVIISSWGLC